MSYVGAFYCSILASYSKFSKGLPTLSMCLISKYHSSHLRLEGIKQLLHFTLATFLFDIAISFTVDSVMDDLWWRNMFNLKIGILLVFLHSKF